MKVILHAKDGARTADLIQMASVASFALENGIIDKPVGEIMVVTHGLDYANSFGVIRRKGCITVYPPGGSSDADA